MEHIKTNFNKDEYRAINWRTNTSCNYNCSYCLVNKKNPVTIENPSKFLKKIKVNLPGRWEFVISGGEPFLQPNFLGIIKGLIKMGHIVTVITNFSAPLSQIKKFCRITRGKLKYLAASLHLEYACLDSFFKKAIEVNKIIGRLFSVVSVAKKNNLKYLERIGKKFTQKGIRFRLQALKMSNGQYVGFSCYSPRGKKIIKQFGQEFGLEKPNFKGKKCWAGCRYLLLDTNGDTFRCHSAKVQNKDYLGNILNGTLKLYKKAKPCPYDLCICLTPYTRGLIEIKYK